MSDTTKAAPTANPSGGIHAYTRDGKVYLHEGGVETGPHEGTVEDVLRAAAERKGLVAPASDENDETCSSCGMTHDNTCVGALLPDDAPASAVGAATRDFRTFRDPDGAFRAVLDAARAVNPRVVAVRAGMRDRAFVVAFLPAAGEPALCEEEIAWLRAALKPKDGTVFAASLE